MIPVNQICRGPDASKLAGISTGAVQKRVNEGLLVPVMGGKGRGSRRFFSFQQILATRLHHECIEAGVDPAIARKVFKAIEGLPNLEELVESGRHYLVGDGDHLNEQPMTLAESRDWYSARQNAKAESDAKGPVSLEFRIDFGLTWRCLKPLMIERAAAQQRAK